MASAAAWMASIAIVAVYGRRPDRKRHLQVALGLAIVAWGLGRINSDRISSLEVDRSEMIEQARQAQTKLRQDIAAARGESVIDVRFAEDTGKDVMDVAGLSTQEVVALERESGLSGGLNELTYRAKGVQSRDAGKKRSKGSAITSASAEYLPVRRQMKEADVYAANRWDRVNLLMLRLVLWIVTGVFLWDYFQRLNRALESYVPLPLTCRWLDDWFPKSPLVLVRSVNQAAIQTFLKSVVRKGETFIYFGERDAVDVQSLVRLGAWRLRLWTLPKLVYGAVDVPADPEFLLDAVWFGRYAVVIADPGAAAGLFGELCNYLSRRAATGAVATHTVNVIWDHREFQDEAGTVVALAGRTNFRCIWWNPSQQAEAFAAAYPGRKEITDVISSPAAAPAPAATERTPSAAPAAAVDEIIENKEPSAPAVPIAAVDEIIEDVEPAAPVVPVAKGLPPVMTKPTVAKSMPTPVTPGPEDEGIIDA